MAREPAEITALRRVLGSRLAVFRQAADLTQGQLARVAFCDRTTVVHIEKGHLRDFHRRLSAHYDGDPFVDEFTARAFEALGVVEWA